MEGGVHLIFVRPLNGRRQYKGGALMSVKLVAFVATLFTLLLLGIAFAGNLLAYQPQLPIVGFAHDVYTVEETAGEVIIPISINKAPAEGEDVVVEFSTVPGTAGEGPDGDYLDSTAVLTFTNTSDATQFVFVTVLDDDTAGEAEETVNLILRLLTPDTARLGRGAATLVITDDDLPPPTPTRENVYLQPVLKHLEPTPTAPPVPTEPPPANFTPGPTYTPEPPAPPPNWTTTPPSIP
jgi:hypothetical protein